MPGVTKADPSRLRQLTLRHTGSRAVKTVTFLGIGYGYQREGSPSRLVARVHWGLAGDYEIECTEGFVMGLAVQSHLGQGWKLESSDLLFVQQQRQLEIERRARIAEEEDA